ncbi:hypothetical protein CDAR_295071 [Caerostris darwini]|uniref:Uncharacterized protein n=1 Tax=Caerostris darwini TaxID=1538125 RepID=A0AAV4UKP6_9ARAC|nr:hypothetical protein CDAR_295071 [Caerostris darwini]
MDCSLSIGNLVRVCGDISEEISRVGGPVPPFPLEKRPSAERIDSITGSGRNDHLWPSSIDRAPILSWSNPPAYPHNKFSFIVASPACWGRQVVSRSG